MGRGSRCGGVGLALDLGFTASLVGVLELTAAALRLGLRDPPKLPGVRCGDFEPLDGLLSC